MFVRDKGSHPMEICCLVCGQQFRKLNAKKANAGRRGSVYIEKGAERGRGFNLITILMAISC
jgi:hypothetical protein